MQDGASPSLPEFFPAGYKPDKISLLCLEELCVGGSYWFVGWGSWL